MTAVRLHAWGTRPSATSMYSLRTLNVGFFHGAALPDPGRLLEGSGKFMRHVKLRPGTATHVASLSRLIEMAYLDIKARVENG